MKTRLLKRRHVLLSLGALTLAGGGRLGCFRLARPSGADGPMSLRARTLIDRAWKGLDPRRVLDTHVHVVGLGAGGTGCWVNPRLSKLTHPIDYFKFSIYRAAAGVEDDERADQQYVERLASLLRAEERHGRALILAFDQAHDEAGRPWPEVSEFFTPNAYVLELAQRNPDVFVPGASIHPYRPDAVEALHQAVEGGAVAVKWLPNAMRIDPASPRCDRFYEALAKLGVPLISHAGEEKAVEAEEAQRLGNPLLLRRALDHGVTVVMPHCASLGQNPDLDAPKTGGAHPWVDNFDLCLRLFSEEKYRERLYADVSALTQVNRVGRPLREVLKRSDLHSRLCNGSDYPLPAINVLTQTRALAKEGFITAAEREGLNEIDQHNPFLFDFVLKRTVKWLEAGQELRFPDEVFLVHPRVFPSLA